MIVLAILKRTSFAANDGQAGLLGSRDPSIARTFLVLTSFLFPLVVVIVGLVSGGGAVD